LTITSSLTNLILAASLLTTGLIQPNNPKPLAADWCQCVIFILNLLGIQQIQGEYWTATSLAVPDKTGKSWMDYQGYTKRMPDQVPQTGDIMVLEAGAQVITVQTWDGSEHLVPVPVDAWAGHIGIVLNTEPVVKAETAYLQVNLLSANWGVNSRPLGVVGSCFNVDESNFLLPEGYKKASFFYATDPLKMRERMVNRASRWALLGLAANPQASMDGFPITPSGFISYVLQPVGKQPLTPVVTDIKSAVYEISPEAVLEGDFVLFGDENNPGLGIIVSVGLHEKDNSRLNFGVISMLPGKRVTGPDPWGIQRNADGWIKELSDMDSAIVRFYRFQDLPGYPAIPGSAQISSGKNEKVRDVGFVITNGGGTEISLSNLEINAYRVAEDGNQQSNPSVITQAKKELTLKPGEFDLVAASIYFPVYGEYTLEIQYEWKNDVIRKLDTDIVTIN
jgi:hypothetical protein